MNNNEWMSPGSVLIKTWAHLKMELSWPNCPRMFYWGDKTESRDNQLRDYVSPSSHAPSLTSKVVTSTHTLFSLGSKRESCCKLCPLGKSDWYDQEDRGKDHTACSFFCSFGLKPTCTFFPLTSFPRGKQSRGAGVVVVGACLLESDVSLSLMGSEGRNSLSCTQLSSPTGRAEGPAEPTVQAVFSSPALARAKVWFYSH